MAKLDVKAIGLSLGIVWGLGVLLMGIAAMLWGYGTKLVLSLGTIYIGFAPTIIGSIIGTIWGFFDALIGGIIVGWLYNKISK